MNFFRRQHRFVQAFIMSLILGVVFIFLWDYSLKLFGIGFQKMLFEPFGKTSIGPYWPLIAANLFLGCKMGRTAVEKAVLSIFSFVCSYVIGLASLLVYIAFNPIII